MRFLLLTLALLLGSAARAGDGHDHGGAEPVAAGPALPRFAASSDLFELVGVLDGHHLRVWLDHAPSNAPVENATLALELNGQAVALQSVAAGEFEAELATEPGPGTHPVTATITAGADADLLAGELDIHAPAIAEAGHGDGWRSWGSWAPWAGGGLVVALALVALFKRRNPGVGAAA